MDLRKEINRQGLRQDWIAAQIGISTTYLSRLISGERTNKEMLGKITEFLNKRKQLNSLLINKPTIKR